MCTFYTENPTHLSKETPLYQGCIKNCIKKKQDPTENPSPNKGSLFDVYQKRHYVNHLCIRYTA